MKNEKNEKTASDVLKEILLETIKRKEKEELEKRRKAQNEFKKKLAESEPLITKKDFEKTKEKIAMYERKNVKEDLSLEEQRKELEQFAKRNHYNIKNYLSRVSYTNLKPEELAEKEQVAREQVKKSIDLFIKNQKREKANMARSRAMKELWQNEFYRQEMIKRMRTARELKRKVNPPKKQGKEENE